MMWLFHLRVWATCPGELLPEHFRMQTVLGFLGQSFPFAPVDSSTPLTAVQRPNPKNVPSHPVLLQGSPDLRLFSDCPPAASTQPWVPDLTAQGSNSDRAGLTTSPTRADSVIVGAESEHLTIKCAAGAW